MAQDDESIFHCVQSLPIRHVTCRSLRVLKKSEGRGLLLVFILKA